MVLFTPCKINIGLHITGKRPDGYHNLETVFYPIPFYDILEAVLAPAFAFTATGLPIPGNAGDNICVKAYHLLKEQYPALPAVHLHLHKHIPMGAGLGGGSSNGAHTLVLLNKLSRLGLTNEQLAALALQLGSDCPFFIESRPSLGKGRGEELSPLPLHLQGYCLVLVFPGLHISTAEAFAGITPLPSPDPLEELIAEPIHMWKQTILNDFEETVFPQHPSLGLIKEQLYNAGAVYASMSGSGSTIYGLFEQKDFDVGRLMINDKWLMINLNTEFIV